MNPTHFMVFDVESIGLHGEGFAVGWVVIDRFGKRVNQGLYSCPPSRARGTEDDRQWVSDNIPGLPTTHDTPRTLRDGFWSAWEIAKSMGAQMVADCAWPVEARFLNDCVDDLPGFRKFDGPYPLLDLSSVLLARGLDPLGEFQRTEHELPKHNPLADAKQSARILIEVLTGARK